MASKKQAFAKGARGYAEIFGEVLVEAPPVPFIAAAILGAAVGGASIGVIDATKPLDDTPQLGQEIAIDQYEAALDVLSEKRDAYRKAQGSSYFTPGPLENIIDVTEDDKGNKDAAVAAETSYKSLLDSFVSSVHLDARLNEEDAKGLLDSFEQAHGQIEDVTSFEYELDYNDLMEARASSELAQDASDENKAKQINQLADTNLEENFWMISGVTAGVPFALAIIFGLMGGTLRRWEKNEPKKRKPKSGYQH